MLCGGRCGGRLSPLLPAHLFPCSATRMRDIFQRTFSSALCLLFTYVSVSSTTSLSLSVAVCLPAWHPSALCASLLCILPALFLLSLFCIALSRASARRSAVASDEVQPWRDAAAGPEREQYFARSGVRVELLSAGTHAALGISTLAYAVAACALVRMTFETRAAAGGAGRALRGEPLCSTASRYYPRCLSKRMSLLWQPSLPAGDAYGDVAWLTRHAW